MSGIIGGAGSKSGVIGTTELDYEEGTWTPQLTGNSAVNLTMSGETGGTYIKIGNKVFLEGVVQTSSLNSAVGSIYVSGFPFKTRNNSKWYSGFFGRAYNLNIDAGDTLTTMSEPNTYHAYIYTGTNEGTTNLSHTDWSADGLGYFTHTYYAQ